MKKIVKIDSCSKCPYYDNEYYSYNEKCKMLDIKVGPGAIPDNCPLESAKEEEI